MRHRPCPRGSPDEAGKPDFGNLLRQQIDKVNETQQTASEMRERFERGDPNVDLTEVMVSMQKASLSFKAMTEVRNKLVEDYREVMNMSI